MMLMTRSFGLLLLVAELFSTVLLFYPTLSHRRLSGLRWAGCVLIMTAVVLFLSWRKDRLLSGVDQGIFNESLFFLSYLATMISEILIFALFTVSICFIFRVRLFQAAFIACASYAVRNLARCFFALWHLNTSEVRTRTFSLLTLQKPESIAAFVLIYVAVYALCWFVFFRRYHSGDEAYFSRGIMGLLLVIILMNSVLGAVNEPHDSQDAAELYNFILVARIFLAVTGLTVQFFALTWVKMRFQRTQMEHMLETQKAQYDIARRSIDTVNINAHDLRHQIHMILEAVKTSGDLGSVENELGEMSRMIDEVDSSYHTGNRAMDVVLTEKARVCRSRSISFSAIAQGDALAFMSDVDLYTLLGNVLDNAIEAAEKIPNPEERILSLQIRREGGMTLVHEQNAFAVEPRFVNGLPRTSKQDQAFHGFGVKSIAQTAEKYGGVVKMHVEDHTFHVDVLFAGT